MAFTKLRDLLLPVLLLAFIGGAITFLQPVLNVATRWGILAFIAAYLLINGQLVAPLRTSFGLLTLLAIVWALATSAWSEAPELSLAKVSAFALMSFAGMAIGQQWLSNHPPEECLNYLFPLTVGVLVAGAWGNTTGSSVVVSGNATLYQGAVSGPNMFGAMVAMCFPLLAWQCYRYWTNGRKRVQWLLLAVVALYYVAASGSRASMMVVLCTSAGLFLSLGAGPKFRLFILILSLVASAVLLAPNEVAQFEHRILYKQETAEKGVFHTREEPWLDSYEAAVEGGWFGAGYGVSVGETMFETAFSTFGYGREKGNSQLAIVEETGLAGLAIYVIMLLFLFFHLGQTWLRLPRGSDKVLVGVVTGTLLGMVVHSGFEAWWTAPASPESAYFWTLAGVALTLRAAKAKA